jgi:hypothetical protein
MPAYLSWTKYLVPSNQYCRQDLAMGLSHQIFFDIMEARREGFEVDNAFEFDYNGSIEVASMRIDPDILSGIDLLQTNLYLS